MKKVMTISLCAAFILGGCGTYTGTGAVTGASLGGIFGSAVGGISDGPRGSDMGTLIGMAGGAVVGAAIGAAADQEREEQISEMRQSRTRSSSSTSTGTGSGSGNTDYSSASNDYYDDSGYDPTNSGDDRLDVDLSSEGGTDYSSYTDACLTIRNVAFTDNDGDGLLSPGETGKITFEVMNYTPSTVYNVQPSVTETSGNKNIYISSGICVESVLSGKGIRYTAMVKGGSKLKNGTLHFQIAVTTGDGQAQPEPLILDIDAFK